FERDMRHALVDKALPDVVFGLVFRRYLPAQFSFLLDALGRVRQQIVGVLRSHEAGARQRQGDTAGVAGDPSAAPLLGHVGGGAAAAGRVEHQVSRVGRHEDTSQYDLGVRLDDVHLVLSKRAGANISPKIVDGRSRKVVQKAHVTQ